MDLPVSILTQYGKNIDTYYIDKKTTIPIDYDISYGEQTYLLDFIEFNYGLGIENEVAIVQPLAYEGVLTVYQFDTSKIFYKYHEDNPLVRRYTNTKYLDTEIGTNEFDKKKYYDLISSVPNDFTKYLEGNGGQVTIKIGRQDMTVELGGQMLEFANKNYLNSSIHDTIVDLKDMRNKTLVAFKKLFKIPESADYYSGQKYKSVKYRLITRLFNNGEVLPPIQYNYLGSYHFNVTLPHIRSMRNEEGDLKSFTKDHLIYMNVLQYLEPVLLGVFGVPDFRNKDETERGTGLKASYRLFNSPTMFIDTSKVNTMYLKERDYKYKDEPDSLTNEYVSYVKSIVGSNLAYLETRNRFIRNYINNSHESGRGIGMDYRRDRRFGQFLGLNLD